MPRRIVCALWLAAFTAAMPARATECAPATGISPCIDADPLWMAPGHARFVSIASPKATPVGAAAFGVGASYLRRPLVLTTPSPDPDDREVALVDHVFDASLLFAMGVAQRVEVGASLPMALHQTGAGAEGATSQSAPPLTPTAVRDPRLGVGWALLRTGDMAAVPGFGVKARLLASLPLGDEGAFAGEPGWVVSPSFAMALQLGAWTLGSELGLRLRETTELATARVGSQLFSSLGVGVDVLGGQLLGVYAEAWLAPMLGDQSAVLADGTHTEDALQAPAEWLLSVRSAPTADDSLVLQLGAGMGIPASTETRVSPDGTRAEPSHFVGVTAPAYRVVLAVRYVPPEPEPARQR